MLSIVLTGQFLNSWRQDSDFSDRMAKKIRKLKLYWNIYKLKKMSESLPHLQTLIAKMQFGLPIRDGESEVQSFLDAKRHFGKDWPYMWSVKNVSDDMVDVDNSEFKCETFSSYAYLDFVRDKEVQEFALATAEEYAPGNHGPRMLGGNTKVLCEFEEALAKFLGKEAVLLASSGYLACMSAIHGIAHKGDLIIADQYSHASLRAGLKLSGAKVRYFKHNNFKHAEDLIQKNKKSARRLFMVIESVYSMDGDLGDLPVARALCDKYDMTLIVDEAHGLGVVGATGRGLEEHYHMPGAADIIVGSLTKSMSSVGGYVAAKKDIIEYFEFHSQGNMFSAPLSVYHAAAALASLRKLEKDPSIVQNLQEMAIYFRNKLNTAEWDPSTPEHLKFSVYGVEEQAIQPIVFKDDPMRVMRIATNLKKAGYLVGPVVAPACPLREPRLRVTTQSSMTKEQIDRFVATLVKVAENTAPVMDFDLIN
mmetsp:Transcript_32814/g.37212  ORF Transcript_32814/g.37212 Transcript_32814/m.37212 type:complete len:478 (-) Transcript_32814:439-1872(-)